jgi:hypothetical protein
MSIQTVTDTQIKDRMHQRFKDADNLIANQPKVPKANTSATLLAIITVAIGYYVLSNPSDETVAYNARFNSCMARLDTIYNTPNPGDLIQPARRLHDIRGTPFSYICHDKAKSST